MITVFEPLSRSVAVVCGVLLTAGCTAVARGQVTLTWWTGQTDEAETVSEGLAREYEAAHPGVRIVTQAAPSTTDVLITKLAAGLLAGEYPDISYAYGTWAAELATSDRVQDLTEYTWRPDVHWNELPAAARQVATVGGRIVGMPAVVDDVALVYNRKLFDAAGLAYPSASWTWDDFRVAARRLTDREAHVYGTVYPVSGREDTTWLFWPLLWQHGGTILDGGRPAFDSEAGAAALETLRAIAVDDRSMYLDRTDERGIPLFVSGHIGMILSGPWALSSFDADTDYGVAPLPGLGGDHRTVIGPDLWMLFDHGDPRRVAAARDFVAWLTSSETDVRWNLPIGNLPLRPSEQDTPEFRDYTRTYPGAEVFAAALSSARSRPTTTGYPALSRAVGDAISAVLDGADRPRSALATAARQR